MSIRRGGVAARQNEIGMAAAVCGGSENKMAAKQRIRGGGGSQHRKSTKSGEK